MFSTRSSKKPWYTVARQLENAEAALKNLGSVHESALTSVKFNNQNSIKLASCLGLGNPHPKLSLMSNSGNALPQQFSLDFTSKGVGGHKTQLKQIIQESFLPRALPTKYREAYGEQHQNAGILLYGPPGTGKTLIARSIAECFSKHKVKIINGPELKSKYVGQSQENLRNIFSNAEREWHEKGDESDLHVFIFDEIDALVPQRGSRSGSTGVDDDMVAQFLTILDGVDSPKNIIVIGTTNRKDLIDPALLRHGRLGVVIETGLPDEEARLEILYIHTEIMRANNLIEVDLKYWAKKTLNYTGGEIEQLVSRARHSAEANNFEGTTEIFFKESIQSKDQLSKVTEQHFAQAFSEIVPAFGIDAKFVHFKPDNFVVYNNAVEQIIEDFKSSLTALKNKDMNQLNYLVSGEQGVGKTCLAMHLANISGAEYIKIISPDILVHLSLEKKLIFIEETFENAHKAPFSAIILDQLEDLLEADTGAHSCNNQLRIMLSVMLKKSGETNNICLVIATASDKNFIERMRLYFHEKPELYPINLGCDHSAVKNICNQLNYTIVERGKYSIDNHQMPLTIRDLIYNINKFTSQEGNIKVFNIDGFYQSIFEKNEKILINTTNLSSSKDSLFSIKSTNRVSNIAELNNPGKGGH